MIKEGAPFQPRDVSYKDLYEALASAAIAHKIGMRLPAYRDYLIGSWVIAQLVDGKELNYADIQAKGVSYDQAIGIMSKVRSRIWGDSDHTKKLEGHFKPVPGHKKGLKYFFIEDSSSPR